MIFTVKLPARKRHRERGGERERERERELAGLAFSQVLPDKQDTLCSCRFPDIHLKGGSTIRKVKVLR
jgi:hypothetical protein